jgi:pantothenate kinase
MVVSEETVSGGAACNDKRAVAGLNEMALVVIDLVEDTEKHDGRTSGHTSTENKVSSTNTRLAQLGTLRTAPPGWTRRSPSKYPYLIGLTGGIACGKSAAARLATEAFGAHVIDCDKLGHEVSSSTMRIVWTDSDVHSSVCV